MIMQKLINALAVISFLGTASIIGGGTYVYLNREALAEQARERITKAVTAAVTDAIPGMLDSAVPSLPPATGGAIPSVGGAAAGSLSVPGL